MINEKPVHKTALEHLNPEDRDHYERLSASIRDNRMKDFRCGKCGKLLFRARAVDGASIEIPCPKCKTLYKTQKGE